MVQRATEYMSDCGMCANRGVSSVGEGVAPAEIVSCYLSIGERGGRAGEGEDEDPLSLLL